MAKPIYLDNSVFGGYYDKEFSEHTRKLFDEIRKGIYTPHFSSFSLQEIQRAPEKVRGIFAEIIGKGKFLETTPDISELSKAYLEAGKFGKRMLLDTLHIATATVYGVGLLVSWNFHDIVNLDKIRIYNGINVSRGYAFIEIRTPREVLHEKEL